MAAPTLNQLLPYVGGEFEIQGLTSGYQFRGPINAVTENVTHFRVGMDWVARGIGDPEPSSHWVMTPKLDYKIPMQVCHAAPDKYGRLVLTSSNMHELTIFYPPSYAEKLDRADVADKVILFMDDLRDGPTGSLVSRDIDSILQLFARITKKRVRIDELWLDHDLGKDEAGITVDIMPLVAKLEEAAVHIRPYNIGTIYVHSDNSSAREVILRSLKRYGYNCRVASFR